MKKIRILLNVPNATNYIRIEADYIIEEDTVENLSIVAFAKHASVGVELTSIFDFHFKDFLGSIDWRDEYIKQYKGL